MAHEHHHHHDLSAYYTEQLCTIAFCGAFGGIAVAIYATGLINNVLAAGILHYSLLAGGIALLVLVFLRAVALWFSVGEVVPDHHHDHGDDCCGHDHEHEHAVTTASEGLPLVTETGHGHHHHDHSHSHSHDGHDHDHSWAPVRYIVLLVPVLLYFFVPLNALSPTGSVGYKEEIKAEWMNSIKSTGDLGQLDFKELDGAALVESRRDFYKGKIARITGQFMPSPNDRVFSLVRYKIRCCAADAIPLPAPVVIDDSQIAGLPAEQRLPNGQALRSKWVEVTCQIQFQQRPDRPNEWVTVLVVQPTKAAPISELIKLTNPDPNPYL